MNQEVLALKLNYGFFADADAMIGQFISFPLNERRPAGVERKTGAPGFTPINSRAEAEAVLARIAATHNEGSAPKLLEGASVVSLNPLTYLSVTRANPDAKQPALFRVIHSGLPICNDKHCLDDAMKAAKQCKVTPTLMWVTDHDGKNAVFMDMPV